MWLMRNSPLGHQVSSLTSMYAILLFNKPVFAQVRRVGVQLPLGHQRQSDAGQLGSRATQRSIQIT